MFLLFLLAQDGPWGWRGCPLHPDPCLLAEQSLSCSFTLVHSLFSSPRERGGLGVNWHRALEHFVDQKSFTGTTKFQFWKLNLTQQKTKQPNSQWPHRDLLTPATGEIGHHLALAQLCPEPWPHITLLQAVGTGRELSDDGPETWLEVAGMELSQLGAVTRS